MVKLLPSITDSEEANIIETGTNSPGDPWDFHAALIDGEGFAGAVQDINGKKCGISLRSSTQRAFFYMKLAKPSTVMKM